MELDKNSTGAIVLLAQIQAAKGQTDQAVANYQRAIELSPNDARLHYALGSLYESTGKWQQAQASYQKALSIQPEITWQRTILPAAARTRRQPQFADVGANRAQGCRLANSADTLGWAYYSNGAYTVAAPLF